MRDYGALNGGADAVTQFTGEFVHQYLQIGDGTVAPDIKSLNISIGGDNPIRVELGNANVLNTISFILKIGHYFLI